MKMAVTFVALALGLSGCLSNKYDAEDKVRQRLRDPGSAEFSAVETYPTGKNGGQVVCGHVNSKNGMGGMTGDQRFVVGGITVLEEELGHDAMDGVWSKMCREG